VRKATVFEPAQGGIKALQTQNFGVNSHEKYASLAGIAGTQPALCSLCWHSKAPDFDLISYPAENLKFIFFDFEFKHKQEANPRRLI